MGEITTKIGEYQQELYRKLHVSYFPFPDNQEIQIGDNAFICGVYLGTTEEKNWFCKLYLDVAEVYADISLFSLSDGILHQIAHILRNEI